MDAPIAGDHYPRTLQEFASHFSTEEDCVAYLAAVRWADGFQCRTCGNTTAWQTTKLRWICTACRTQNRLLAGTLLEDTRLPLRTWLMAMWVVTNQKNGISALGLQRLLGLGSYHTAFMLLHKLRRAMVRPGRDRLNGCVEVDETYVGGRGNHRGRGGEEKDLVAIAVELDERGKPRRVRLATIPDASTESLFTFVLANIEPGSRLITDGWAAYHRLTERGYLHEPRNVRATGHPAHEILPNVHRVAALLKRWLLGTHQGATEDTYLDDYL